jgi:ribonuclease HI
MMVKPVPIRVTQINLQHCKEATANLCCDLARLQTYIALVQEPYWFKGYVRGLVDTRNSKLYQNHIGDAPGRTCIVASKDIPGLMIPELSSRDITVVRFSFKIGGESIDIIFVSLYLPYDLIDLPPTLELTNVIDYCNRLDAPCIIGCDSNSHHTVWGSSNINSRGRSLLEYIISTDLDIANKGNDPTFVNRNREEVIDITLVSGRISHIIKDWKVNKQASLSDHRRIEFSLNMDAPTGAEHRNPRKTNWSKYDNELRTDIACRIPTIRTVNQIEEVSSTLVQTIKQAYEKSCPISKNKNKSVPWWTKQIHVKRKEVTQSYWTARQSKQSEDWDKYYLLKKEYKKLIRHSKRSSWRNYCAELSKYSDSARLIKLLRQDRLAQIGAVKRNDGSITSNIQDTLVELLKAHFPKCKFSDNSAISVDSGNYDWKVENHASISKIVNNQTVEWAVKSFQPYKTPGEDGIYPILLQKGLPHIRHVLIAIFRASMNLGYIPKIFRGVKVVFIPKPGKVDYTSVKSFRPISISSFILKTLEKIIDNFIFNGSIRRCFFSSNQHAYIPGRSTETALAALVSKVGEALEKQEWMLGLFFDIEGAFDNASHQKIESALSSKGVPDYIVKWVGSSLRHRTITATYGDVKVRVEATRGCPQGGCLSPHLWCTLVDDLLALFHSRRVYIQCYSDDGLILIQGRYIDTVSEVMQDSIYTLERWCKKNQLTVSPSKTDLVLFTNRRKIPFFRRPKLFDQDLNLKTEVKYLGVTIDQRLTFKSHIENKSKQAQLSFLQCRRAIGKSWGLKPKIIRWVYTAIIRPCLVYGSLIWWHKCNTESIKKTLGQVQRLACLAITGAMRTTPTAAMEAILSLPPLEIFIKEVASSSCYRLIQQQAWNTKGNQLGYKNILSRIQSEPCLHMRSDILTKETIQNKFYCKIPTREEWAENNLPPQNAKVCFTDGSKIDQKGSGAGVHIDKDVNVAFPLGKYATVFQAEIWAILMCAQMLEQSEDRVICICSDSQAAIKALQKLEVRSKIVKDCKEALNNIARERTVMILWVPGHSSIAGNEKADSLARRGSLTIPTSPEPIIGLPTSYCKNYLKDITVREHLKYWTATMGCRQTKELVPKPESKLTDYCLRLSKENLKLLTGVLTGHIGLKRHLHILKLVSEPDCRLCENEDETPLHLLSCCKSLSEQRKELMGKTKLSRANLVSAPVSKLFSFYKYICRTLDLD